LARIGENDNSIEMISSSDGATGEGLERKVAKRGASHALSKAAQDSVYGQCQAVEGLARRFIEQTLALDLASLDGLPERDWKHLMTAGIAVEKPKVNNLENAAHLYLKRLRSYVSFSPPLLFLSRRHEKLADRTLYSPNELSAIEAWSLVVDHKVYPNVLCLTVADADDEVGIANRKRARDSQAIANVHPPNSAAASSRKPQTRFSRPLHPKMMNNGYMIQMRVYHCHAKLSASRDSSLLDASSIGWCSRKALSTGIGEDLGWKLGDHWKKENMTERGWHRGSGKSYQGLGKLTKFLLK
jgi:hypothetical protein